MSRIADTFARCKAANRAAFIPFIMAGDPNAQTTLKLLDSLAEGGADIIELGIPFSDPMADGKVIQEAGIRALASGMTLRGVLAIAAKFRTAHPTVPLVLMGYVNPIYVYGFETFARDAQAAGVDGVIIVDLPPEEASEIEPKLAAHAIDFVRLIAPTSVPDRLPLLTADASGYLYYISITGITGAAAAPATRIKENLSTIRNLTKLPICVGFGIKTPADVKEMADLADGVVVGSAIVKLIGETKGDVAKVAAFVRSLADGCVHKTMPR